VLRCNLLFNRLSLLLLFSVGLVQASELTDQQIADLSLQMFVVQGPGKELVVEQLASEQDKSLIPTFVLAMRWTGSNVYVAKALSDLTGEKITNWHEAYNWQERHPEITPHSTYRNLKLRFLGNTDRRFLDFFVPPLSVDEADYLLDTDLVFGVEINGDVRAYPLRIMGWHEMFNDVIGGVPVALAYCTLCGSGILYDTRVEGREKPFVFGSSGLLYRSNKLMFDRETNSLWNQYSGEPVSGPLVDSGIKLNILPVTITSWESWRTLHPDTTVLSLETGHIRNYDSGFVYHDYFSSPGLMFPAVVEDESRLSRKDYVFGLRTFAASKAWPLSVFEDMPVINDSLGNTPVVLVGDTTTRTVRAYERAVGEKFELASNGQLRSSVDADEQWQLQEGFLVDATGKQKRVRLPGHISYWFAWENFMGVNSELYK